MVIGAPARLESLVENVRDAPQVLVADLSRIGGIDVRLLVPADREDRAAPVEVVDQGGIEVAHLEVDVRHEA